MSLLSSNQRFRLRLARDTRPRLLSEYPEFIARKGGGWSRTKVAEPKKSAQQWHPENPEFQFRACCFLGGCMRASDRCQRKIKLDGTASPLCFASQRRGVERRTLLLSAVNWVYSASEALSVLAQPKDGRKHVIYPGQRINYHYFEIEKNGLKRIENSSIKRADVHRIH